jgi:hypothetical protein
LVLLYHFFRNALRNIGKEKDLLLLFFVLIYTYFIQDDWRGFGMSEEVKLNEHIEKEQGMLPVLANDTSLKVVEEKVVSQAINSTTKKPFNIPEALLIGIIPFLAYGLLYSYESNYLQYFGVPSRFINYDIGELIIISVILFSAIMTIFGWINIFYSFAHIINKKLLRRIVIASFVGFTYATSLAYTFLETDQSTLAIIIFMFGLILPIVFFVPPLFSKSKEKYSERLEKTLRAETEIGFRSLVDEIASVIGTKGLDIAVYYIFIFIAIGRIGYMNAYKLEYSYVIKTIPECTVVYTNTDKLICKTINLQKKEFEKGYIVYYLQDLKGVNIDWEEIGPLRLKPTAIPTSTPIITPTFINTPVSTNIINSTATP